MTQSVQVNTKLPGKCGTLFFLSNVLYSANGNIISVISV